MALGQPLRSYFHHLPPQGQINTPRGVRFLGTRSVSLSSLRGFQIPLPPLATQQTIVAEIEAEQTLVAANRELIARFEKKIQATLARVWGEESSI